MFAGARQDLIETLLRQARETSAPWCADYLNAAQFNRGESDPAFGATLRSMDLLYADGRSIVWAAHRAGVELPGRLTAADFIGEFLQQAAGSGVSVALVGGRPGSAASFAAFWKRRIPELDIPLERDGFFEPSETASVLESVAASEADVVLVGMGAPRQEALVEEARRRGEARVWWCVGALFEYGPWGKRRAPVWMRRSGLEWLFRLLQEPRRLAGRYLIGNPLFVWRVLMKTK